MNRIKLGNRGNAVLISLIVMASALTISLGLTTVVAGEIRNAGLLPPAERAYYKSESYVEQALWNRKQDPNYEVADAAAVPDSFLCSTTPCFERKPNTKATGLLQNFQAHCLRL